jgi:hypothetical protein
VTEQLNTQMSNVIEMTSKIEKPKQNKDFGMGLMF